MKNGPYELIVAPENYPGFKYRGRYAYEHIVVWWRCRGSVPKKGMEIHHKNMNHRDNRIENLQLVTGSEHRKLHGALLKRKPIAFLCGFCSKAHETTARMAKHRLRHNKSKRLFCGQSCATKYQFRNLNHVARCPI